jgi:hypothetical protein
MSYLKKIKDNISGVISDENGVKNIFFKIDNGNLITSDSPYPGLKYNTGTKFEPFK